MSPQDSRAFPLLEMRGISKSFPGVRALDDVCFTVNAGEVHALVGENGAGKSTLMKILSGAYRADEGEIFIDGKPAQIESPKSAVEAGVGIVYQELNLIPELDVVANITLGCEPSAKGILNQKIANDTACKILSQLVIDLPLGIPVRQLSVAEQQIVEIAKALNRKARIIVMDEPTAALTDRETDRLFEMIEELKNAGTGIIYISHRLEELKRIVNRITVLRDGKTVETRTLDEMPQDEMVRLMVGRTIDKYYPELTPISNNSPIVLKVDNLRSAKVKGVSFEVRSVEILGIAGLVGAGRTETVRAIAAADRPHAGNVSIDGTVCKIASPRHGIKAGIALITEDRKSQGLVLNMSVVQNTTLCHLGKFSNRLGIIDKAAENSVTQDYIEKLKIRTPNVHQQVANLSGGNQQKVVLAKWLVGQARVFIFDEPTRGIDVGSKAEIYELLLELARQGASIIIVSSDLPEVLNMSHRVLVMREGKIAACLSRDEATPDKVIAIATGASI
jgi:ribose transport system ATP-binding protein